jgi:hypothetical protein
MQAQCIDCGVGIEFENLVQANFMLQRLKSRRVYVSHVDQDYSCVGCDPLFLGELIQQTAWCHVPDVCVRAEANNVILNVLLCMKAFIITLL